MSRYCIVVFRSAEPGVCYDLGLGILCDSCDLCEVFVELLGAKYCQWVHCLIGALE
jgi:hypothetical protein